MKKRITLSNGIIVIDELPEQCVECIMKSATEDLTLSCPITHEQRRISRRSSSHGSLMACSEGTKIMKYYRQEVQTCMEMLPFMNKQANDLKQELIRKGETRYLQLTHNLRTINAHCIQELYDLMPDGTNGTVREAIEATKDAIKNDINSAALAFFHLQKYASMMNVEFLVYDRMQMEKVELSPDNYKIRDVVMKTLHMFFDDFTKKSVLVVIDKNYDRVRLDYESIATALYYIMENATKYIQPSTELKISFSDDEDYYRIHLAMHSYFLTETDRLHIFDNGYSGETAKRKKVNGHGYGMYRANKLMLQCGGKIETRFGKNPSKHEDVQYSYNVFTLCIGKDSVNDTIPMSKAD